MARLASARNPIQQHATLPFGQVGGVANVQVITADANLDPEADLVVGDSGSGMALTLPAVTLAIVGKRYIVKQEAAGAVTVTAGAGDTIDGGASVATAGANEKVEFMAVNAAGVSGYPQWITTSGPA